eukprot:4149563-Amphidinium_carterae.1
MPRVVGCCGGCSCQFPLKIGCGTTVWFASKISERGVLLLLPRNEPRKTALCRRNEPTPPGYNSRGRCGCNLKQETSLHTRFRPLAAFSKSVVGLRLVVTSFGKAEPDVGANATGFAQQHSAAA